MVTDFKLAAELVSELKNALSEELGAIIDAISTTAIPLESLSGLFVGFFDPVTQQARPALFLVPDTLQPRPGEASISSYEAKLHVALYLVVAKGTDDDELVSMQLYNYVKALVVFVNQHLDTYSLEDEITFYETLGAERNQRWAALAISIDTEILA